MGKWVNSTRPRGDRRMGSPFIRTGLQGNRVVPGQVIQTDLAQQNRIKLGRLFRSLGIDANVIGPIAEKQPNPLAWMGVVLPQSRGLMDFERSKGRPATLTNAISSVHAYAPKAKELAEQEKLPIFVAMRILKLYGDRERWITLYVKPWTKQIYSELNHKLDMTVVEKIVKSRTEPDEASHMATEVLDRASRSINRNFDAAVQEALQELGIA